MLYEFPRGYLMILTSELEEYPTTYQTLGTEREKCALTVCRAIAQL